MNTKQWSAWLLAAGITALISVLSILQSGEEIDTNNTRIILANMTQAQKDSVIHAEIHRAKVGDEIVSMRSKNAKTFKGNNGQLRANISASPKHYFDKTDSTYKDIDLTVNEISAAAKLNPLKKFDKYVDAGIYRATWLDSKPHDYTLHNEDYSIEYTALFDLTDITVVTIPNKTGIKQNYILQNDSAPTELRWLIDTDAVIDTSGSDVKFNDSEGSFLFRIQNPIAWDSNMDMISVTSVIHGDTLVYNVDTAGAVYPVVVDPTTTSQATDDNSLYKYVASDYSATRNATTATGTGTKIYVGQNTNTRVYRSYLSFPLSLSMSSVSACSLYLDGEYDASDIDFDIYILGSSYRPTVTTTDFNKFDGWESSGTYSGTVLNETWNTSSYSDAWNIIEFNSDGRDSVLVAQGDTLQVALISKEDYNESEPTGNEYVRFSHSGLGEGTAPYLSITYSTLIDAPQNFTMTAIDASQIACTWLDLSDNEDKFYIINWADLSVVDSTAANAVAATISGLSTNAKYVWAVAADSAGVRAYSDPDSCYTLLPAPESSDITIMPISSDTLRISATEPPNPTTGLTGMQVEAVSGSGATSSGWLDGQYSYLDGGLNPDSTYVYKVRYRNGGGDSTVYSPNITYAMNGLDTLIASLAGDTFDDYNVNFGNGQRDSTVVRTGTSDSGERLDAFLSFSLPWQVVNGGVDSMFLTMTRAGEESLRTPSVTIFGIPVKFGDPIEERTLGSQDSTSATANWTISSGTGSRSSPDLRTIFNEWRDISSLKDFSYDFGLRLDDSSQADSVRAVFLDSSHPSYSNGTRLTIYYTPGSHDFIEAAPGNFSMNVLAPDSIRATWTDNSDSEYGFVILNLADSLLATGTDTLAQNTTSIDVGGLTPNTLYEWFVRAYTAGDDSSSSSSNDSTPARIPGLTTVSPVSSSSISFIISLEDNPGYTQFAVQDSLTGLYVDGSAEPETLRAGPPGVWGWKTYSQWGGAQGDTLTGLLPDSLYVIRAKARTGE